MKTETKLKTSILIILFYNLFGIIDGRYLNGSIRPLNPILTSGPNGSGANISCSLPGFVNVDGVNVTSRNLYFSAGELNVSDSRIVDNLTINLTLKDVSRFHSHVNVFCYANVSGTQRTVAQTSIIIVEPLVPPKFEGCIVYDWKEMVCHWQPEEPDFGIKTDVSFLYSIYCRPSQFNKCQKQVPGKCLFEPGKYHISPYCIQVCFNNTNEKACTNVTFVDSHLLVKPGLVKASSITKSREAEVRLEKPEHEVVCYLDVNGTGKRESIRSEEETIRVEGLKPNMEYVGRVRCKPLVPSDEDEGPLREIGFFSDPFTFNFQAQPDVPDMNPQLVSGCYYFDPSISSDDKSYVHLFWKKVPDEFKNGRMEKTSIALYEYKSWKYGVEGGEARVQDGNPDEFIVQLNWQLDRRKDYLVEVKSYNEIGSNELIQPSRLIIPSISRAPKSPEHIYAILVNNSIKLKWSEVEDADNYTVYWCRLHHSTRKCQANRNITWKSHIPPGTTEMIVPSSGNLDLKVGVSVERFDVELNALLSSGLTWTRCIHKEDADVLPPQNLHFSPHQFPHSLTIVWSHPECSASSYVSGYEVSWCKRNVEVCSKNANDTECCKGNSSVTVSKSKTSLVIERLEPGSEYEVRMRSTSFDRTSKFLAASRSVPDNGHWKVIIGLVITASILAIIFCPIIIIMTVRKVQRSCRDLRKGINIELPRVEDTTVYNPMQYPYSDIGQIKDTLLAEEASADGEAGKEPLVSNGGPSHSGISTYTNVMSKPAYDPLSDDRNALLRAPEDDPPWQSTNDRALTTAPTMTASSVALEGCDDRDDDGGGGRPDQNGQTGADKKAKENVYV